MKTLKVYRRKDGKIMLYVNDYDRRVSLGIAERVFSTKLTKGQKNLYNAFLEAFDKAEVDIENFKELEGHKEDFNILDSDKILYVTDVANVAGNSVGMDGAYIEFDGKLYNLQCLQEALNS